MGRILTLESYLRGLEDYASARFLPDHNDQVVKATLRGLKKEYQHLLSLTVELDKVLLIIGSLLLEGI